VRHRNPTLERPSFSPVLVVDGRRVLRTLPAGAVWTWRLRRRRCSPRCRPIP